MLENEENLGAAFKKLRVDSERSTASLPVSEGASSQTLVESTDESKVKMTFGSKESWHWCLRKPLKGTIRTQRCRRPKSPVLHPPKFIHCTKQMPSCNQSMHKNLTDAFQSNKDLDVPKKFSENELGNHPLELGKKESVVKDSEASMIGIPKNISENIGSVLPTEILKVSDLSDFQSVSEQNQGNFCACVKNECQCKQWQNLNVYMFSDIQNSLQCVSERAAHVQNNPQLTSRISSSSLKSCSEQARAHVDDVTIEDLSGYMEYFLHIPKEMSHMAEMMYT
ncbi:oxidative stress-responsive serine-rich protein 1-like [Pantherophis guttatus]|uniref:Oxidative stress-responsive serine-rich protein 1 n=1 Tax=Pantherophis guttatus TaxID=94885 RepID=A0A6P9BNC3_PANGU|nr:oxidative stress-responsive serine-rich protein 1-like [Pantherophis guttatus]XP_034269751.1 oxidative stress-responsive serine-rich protein 1-like [Pantherophis guttatus]